MLEKIVLSILGEGKSKSDLRKKTLEKVRGIVTKNDSEVLPSDELNLYIEKVARHAYKVLNKDIDTLKVTGFTEDEIYELTVVAAFGAGEARVNLAISLLD